MPRQDLASFIGAVVAGWEVDDLPLEHALFGSVDPGAIASAVDEWCRAHLGSAIDRYEFFDSSSGSVHGVRLTDGRAVVVKGHRSEVTSEYLGAMASAQSALANAGFPAPRPLVAAVSVGAGHLTAETLVPGAVSSDGHDPAVRVAMAQGLSAFIDLAADLRSLFASIHHPMAVPDGHLYPQPHSARFDFAATTDGAEWIDELATEARARLRSMSDGRTVVVHGDWRIQNVRVFEGQLTAVYDWDSVHLEREPVALAPAATTFSVDWNTPKGSRFPSPHEMAAFVADYENARGAPFTDGEHAVLAAAIVASLAYGARCEHADPGRPPEGSDSQRGLLGQLGAGLLEHGLDALRS